MKITRKDSGEVFESIIDTVSALDFSRIRKSKNFVFDWDQEKAHEIYKIYLKSNDDQILGLLAITDIPEELRVHINLLEVTKSQVGQMKTLENIAGCLIAFACAVAFKRGYAGFVSLVPKTRLIGLYQEKYGFRQYGRFLAIEFERSKQLIDKYLGDA